MAQRTREHRAGRSWRGCRRTTEARRRCESALQAIKNTAGVTLGRSSFEPAYCAVRCTETLSYPHASTATRDLATNAAKAGSRACSRLGWIAVTNWLEPVVSRALGSTRGELAAPQTLQSYRKSEPTLQDLRIGGSAAQDTRLQSGPINCHQPSLPPDCRWSATLNKTKQTRRAPNLRVVRQTSVRHQHNKGRTSQLPRVQLR